MWKEVGTAAMAITVFAIWFAVVTVAEDSRSLSLHAAAWKMFARPAVATGTIYQDLH